MTYPEFTTGLYNEPPKCSHEFVRFDDGIYCRKCYTPLAGIERFVNAETESLKADIKRLDEKIEQLRQEIENWQKRQQMGRNY